MIPKIIWQTHNYLYDELPDHIRRCMKTWTNLNPDWEHRYVDHIEREEFVKSRSKELYDFYLVSGPVTQADIWRLLALYEFGGVYCDMDSVCLKPLDYVLQKYAGQEFVSVKKYDDGRINNANFAVPAKSSIMLKIIESAIKDPVENPYWHIWIAFNKHIMNISDNDQFFDAAWHSAVYKDRFLENEMDHIDYYGRRMPYKTYLKDILKLDEEEYLSSIPL